MLRAIAFGDWDQRAGCRVHAAVGVSTVWSVISHHLRVLCNTVHACTRQPLDEGLAVTGSTTATHVGFKLSVHVLVANGVDPVGGSSRRLTHGP